MNFNEEGLIECPLCLTTWPLSAANTEVVENSESGVIVESWTEFTHPTGVAPYRFSSGKQPVG
jgi:hypothetical protein